MAYSSASKQKHHGKCHENGTVVFWGAHTVVGKMRSMFESWKMIKSTRQYWKNDKQVILTLWLQEDKIVGCGSEKNVT